MLNDLNQENVLPFKYVLGDSIYGISPDFIAAVESYAGQNLPRIGSQRYTMLAEATDDHEPDRIAGVAKTQDQDAFGRPWTANR
jgi:hypothetical protein